MSDFDTEDIEHEEQDDGREPEALTFPEMYAVEEPDERFVNGEAVDG